ncbi:MAG: helix-turn-helix domain-containing protein [Anaerolineae bacterium]
MSSVPQVRVLVIARDPLARAGLATLLAAEPGVRVVGQSAESDDTAAEAAMFGAEVLVWDLGWSPPDPRRSLGRLVDAAGAGLVVLALTDGPLLAMDARRALGGAAASRAA